MLMTSFQGNSFKMVAHVDPTNSIIASTYCVAVITIHFCIYLPYLPVFFFFFFFFLYNRPVKVPEGAYIQWEIELLDYEKQKVLNQILWK